MSILFNELSKDIDSGTFKGPFENTLEFFSSEPLIDWLTGQSTTNLIIIENILDRVAKVRSLISKKEKEDPFKDLLFNSLHALSGKSKPNILTEIAELKKELNTFYKNPKVPRYIKLLSKFDLPSLRDVDKTINALLGLRFFPRDAEGKRIYFPSVKDLKRAEIERTKKKNRKTKRKRKTKEENRRRKQESKSNKL